MSTLSKPAIVGALLVFVLFTKFWGLGSITSHMLDEENHTASALVYPATGHLSPDYWYHPPLRHVLLAGSLAVFGDTPIGWRARNAFFGALAILLLLRLGNLLGGERVGLLASALLASDPLLLLASRTTTDEVAAVLFLILFLTALTRYLQGHASNLLPAGIWLGLAFAIKWYFLLLVPFVIALLLYKWARRRELALSSILVVTLTFTVLPAGIYLLSFLPWFGRGYTLVEFLQFEVDAYRELQSQRIEHYINLGRTDPGMALNWFIRPLADLIDVAPAGPRSARFELFLSNFPVLILTIPAVAFAAFRIRRELDSRVDFFLQNRGTSPGALVVLLGTLSSLYLPLLFVQRPIFLYSLIPLLPLVYLLIAVMLTSILERWRWPDRSYPTLVLAALLWGGYLFPLVAGMPVPIDLYAPLLPGTIP